MSGNPGFRMANFAVTAVAGGFVGVTGVTFCWIFSIFTAVFGKESTIMNFNVCMACRALIFAVAGITGTTTFCQGRCPVSGCLKAAAMRHRYLMAAVTGCFCMTGAVTATCPFCQRSLSVGRKPRRWMGHIYLVATAAFGFGMAGVAVNVFVLQGKLTMGTGPVCRVRHFYLVTANTGLGLASFHRFCMAGIANCYIRNLMVFKPVRRMRHCHAFVAGIAVLLQPQFTGMTGSTGSQILFSFRTMSCQPLGIMVLRLYSRLILVATFTAGGTIFLFMTVNTILHG